MPLVDIRQQIEKELQRSESGSQNIKYHNGLYFALSVLTAQIETDAQWVRNLVGDEFDLSGLTDDELCEMYYDSIDPDFTEDYIRNQLEQMSVPQKGESELWD